MEKKPDKIKLSEQYVLNCLSDYDKFASKNNCKRVKVKV